VLFVNFGEKETQFCLPIVKSLRDNGISVELYPDATKLKKQFKYADDRNVKFTAIVGESEMEKNEVTLKNMETGEQTAVKVDELIKSLKK
jgi:histidyl-tRNA synthetase